MTFNGAVLRYFITFACYGSRLHGDESGSVDRGQGAPWLCSLQNSFDIPQKAASLRSRLGTDVGLFSTLLSRTFPGHFRSISLFAH